VQAYLPTEQAKRWLSLPKRGRWVCRNAVVELVETTAGKIKKVNGGFDRLASTGSATEESCRRNVVVELVVVELVETTVRKG